MTKMYRSNELEKNHADIFDAFHSSKSKAEVHGLVELASNGYYPLFFDHWITQALSENSFHLSYKDAKANVDHTLTKLEKHRSMRRKKTALIAMAECERNKFIRSLMRLVEFNIIDKHKEMH